MEQKAPEGRISELTRRLEELSASIAAVIEDSHHGRLALVEAEERLSAHVAEKQCVEKELRQLQERLSASG